MNKKGVSTLELLAYLVAATGTTVVWAYTTFLSKDTAVILKESQTERFDGIDSRLERIEDAQGEILKELRE